MKSYIFWDVTPCFPVKVVSEEHVASEASIDFHRNAQRYIPEIDLFIYLVGYFTMLSLFRLYGVEW
jgi:hypothetical protein